MNNNLATALPEAPSAKLERLGFYSGRSGAHAGRSLMLEDLARVLAQVPATARRAQYAYAIIEDNILEKRTLNNRKHTAKRMAQLYGLDADICLFRNFRRLWEVDADARPVLAATLALARDGIFRASAELILTTSPGATLATDDFKRFIDAFASGRMGAQTLRHTTGNVCTSWRQASYLGGWTRRRPDITPVNLAFSLWLAQLEGHAGENLFHSFWGKMLDRPIDELLELARAASRRGLIHLLQAGSVIEVRFPGYLLPQEEQA